jgi:hypothetical protein
MKPSYISTDQWKSIIKATVYAFLSGFTGTLTLMALDFIRAAQDGKTAIFNLALALLAGAVVGGINGVAVFLKKLFTDPNA